MFPFVIMISIPLYPAIRLAYWLIFINKFLICQKKIYSQHIWVTAYVVFFVWSTNGVTISTLKLIHAKWKSSNPTKHKKNVISNNVDFTAYVRVLLRDYTLIQLASLMILEGEEDRARHRLI